MPLPPDIIKCYKYIDLHTKAFIEELKYVVGIQNVSKDLRAKDDLDTLIHWMSTRLKSLGFAILVKIPDFEGYKGNNPPIIVGTLRRGSKKPTLLYYCHLDVLKVQRQDWKMDPFVLTERDGKLHGRGTAKMKGPLLCFLHAIESYHELGIEFPINIKIICESMHECKSKGLPSVLEELKATFLPDIDCVLMTDSHWLGRDYPCVVYGMRGVCYFNLLVEGPNQDLNSGEFGGVVHEPMQDLLHIIKSLIDPFGRIQVPHFYDYVVPVTPDEEEFYKKIKIDVKEYRNNVGVDRLGHGENLKLVLMHVWRYPWFNMHYINNTCDHNGLDIPRSVFARFSLRIVPHQKHQRTFKTVIDFVNNLVKEMNSPNKIDINTEYPLDPWYENHLHWNYEAANIATKQVYKEDANYIREGNGFPILLKLRDALPNRNILILPIVNCEAKVHNEEENISIRCYIEGTKLLASYFYDLRETWLKHSKAKKTRGRQDICRDRL